MSTLALVLILMAGVLILRAMRGHQDQDVYSPVARECRHPIDENYKYRFLDAAIARQNKSRKDNIINN
jgi:hypothetical protein